MSSEVPRHNLHGILPPIPRLVDRDAILVGVNHWGHIGVDDDDPQQATHVRVLTG